jgi:hypothetical protein
MGNYPIWRRYISKESAEDRRISRKEKNKGRLLYDCPIDVSISEAFKIAKRLDEIQ